jgi:hypothetical protein
MFRRFLPAAATLAMLAACTTPYQTVGQFGDPAPLSAATQTIVITPATKWVNVTGGDTVKFVAGNKAFAWNFDVGSGTPSFELNKVAPPGMLDHKVVAYVAPDPKYIGGGDIGDSGGAGHSGSGSGR